MEIENLISDIHDVHRINLTTLGQEFQALNIDIQNELVDITKVNDVLQRAANIKELTIFDPTDIKLEKISESNTALKIVTWAVAILAFGLIIFCIVSCCPVQIFAMLKATVKAILSILTCTCTTAFMTTSSITKFMRRRQNHLHTSPATNSELNESTDQPGATIRYVPHTAYRRRLFQDEEDSDDELTIYSAKRLRQQQKQQQDYREVQKH
jgi:preprotein translocase subunit SecG